MNISPITNTSNYRNHTSFGMAFKKPSPEVSKIFNETLRPMSPKERGNFVSTIGQIITRAKNCPVDIEHTVATGYVPHYGAKVRNNIYTYDAQKSTNRAESIIETMKTAVCAAENEHNIDINCSRLNEILNG